MYSHHVIPSVRLSVRKVFSLSHFIYVTLTHVRIRPPPPPPPPLHTHTQTRTRTHTRTRAHTHTKKAHVHVTTFSAHLTRIFCVWQMTFPSPPPLSPLSQPSTFSPSPSPSFSSLRLFLSFVFMAAIYVYSSHELLLIVLLVI